MFYLISQWDGVLPFWRNRGINPIKTGFENHIGQCPFKLKLFKCCRANGTIIWFKSCTHPSWDFFGKIDRIILRCVLSHFLVNRKLHLNVFSLTFLLAEMIPVKSGKRPSVSVLLSACWSDVNTVTTIHGGIAKLFKGCKSLCATSFLYEIQKVLAHYKSACAKPKNLWVLKQNSDESKC